MKKVLLNNWKVIAKWVAIVVAIFVALFLVCAGKAAYDEYHKEVLCFNPDCPYSEFIGENVYFHDIDDGKGYVYNSQTHEKTIKNVTWVYKPNGEDSLACFKQGDKRGYLNMKTGQIAIKPQYDHAWIFSEGLACVDDGGRLKFIDGNGQVVIDTKLAYVPGEGCLVFHQGYCVVTSNGGEKSGLMDKNGKLVLPMEYEAINRTFDFGYFYLKKGNEMCVLDKDLNVVLPMHEWELYIDGEAIEATMPDHTIRRYDMEGKMVNDFCIISSRTLEYEKPDIYYRHKKNKEYGEDYDEVEEGPFHLDGTARLMVYVAGHAYEGLMTTDGHIVTMPIYCDIEAIGYDLYLCSVSYNNKVIVNGKGEVVKQ